jgi:mannan endo-1,4-beta-mannosidase
MKGSKKLKEARDRILVLIVIVFAITSILVTYVMFTSSLEDDRQIMEEISETESSIDNRIYIETEDNFSENSQEDDNEKVVSVYENIPVVIPDINTQEYTYRVEAEDTSMYGALHTESVREGYSGTGYVTGFENTESGINRIIFYFYIPSLQHYDLTVRYASDENFSGYVTINGEKTGILKSGNSDRFFDSTFDGVFLDEGYAEIEIVREEGNIDIDYIEINNNTYVYENENDVMKRLSNENASEEAQNLMSYLVDMYGKGIITGQYASSSKNIEIEKINEVTGRYPVIRFGTLTSDDEKNSEEIDACADWSNDKGGIAGLMWYWDAPTGNASIYSSETDFNLADAVTEKEIALRDIDELETMCKNGTISEECLEIVRGIDEISEQLKKLKKQNIPVLWRPLHEAGGEWYWWGSAGSEAYIWLWELLYKRQTVYHDLDNLIWIWNGQSKNFVIDESLYDIASVDIYEGDKTDYGSHFQQYKWLYMLTEKKKLVALSECGTVPDINEIFRDNAMFSFFGLWYGDYIIDENGNYSEKYTSEETIKNMYNSDGAITLDEYLNNQVPSESVIIETKSEE